MRRTPDASDLVKVEIHTPMKAMGGDHLQLRKRSPGKRENDSEDRHGAKGLLGVNAIDP